MTEIRPANVANAGVFPEWQNHDKGFINILLFQHVMNDLRITPHVVCSQNATVCRDQMRGELHLNLAARHQRKFLIELTQMTVRSTNGIGMRALG